ncbi:IPTL-CTERM sorting domain-containing protein [Acidovorax sp. SDU_ACID1]|uniref:IPTL-CTERM sorting domain-containing protein n=1 Tax=Acidovorax sp. SDU_ACID1 TaxID=3136632 RepID=UPI0038734448
MYLCWHDIGGPRSHRGNPDVVRPIRRRDRDQHRPRISTTPASIPTLGEYALLGMSSLLAMLGIAAVRRRQR